MSKEGSVAVMCIGILIVLVSCCVGDFTLFGLCSGLVIWGIGFANCISNTIKERKK